ncbi:alpha/beta hydrolase family protein [Pontixanthobacter aquaemixtae]|uniref:Prolyl oligopeptidase family serine peptidase n=1 Tax=Pontixanthobacter aquaemixtae TaxID=1958940 RepID=A0A844ZZH8_9SPHN|nr:prolyl oligopeptidase family serine peptidase [Pontixanthobacter aquaemixtae]MXO90839.1 prolyl oligopeptidase family serine peptidase [Pontixanthobacter aquaemixtae]
MKTLKSTLLAAAAGALALTAPAASVQAAGEPTVPISDWALRDVVNAVEVSPDGKHVLVHVLGSQKGTYLLQIFKTDDMTKPFRTLDADPMEITGAQWVSDNYIFGNAWQQRRKSVPGPEQGTYDQTVFAYSLKDNKFQQIKGEFGIASLLPDEPESIILEEGTTVDGGIGGVDPFAAFRPRSYYKFNLRKGTKELVLKGSEKYPDAVFDNQGNPRWTRGYDRTTKEAITYYRGIGDSSWKEFERYDQDKHENLYRTLSGFMGLKAFDPNNPNIGYVIDNRGEDKAALWEFNFETGQYGEKLAATDQADIMWIQRHSIPGNDTLVAARYPWAKRERVWFDEEEKVLHEALEAQIPNSHAVSISSRSRDGNTMIVYNSGPRDPGSYWMVKDSKMVKLGSRNPLLKPSDLSDVEFIRYPARDGKTIAGYVTKPKGEGPFPLVVLPHGGPHVNEVIGYDEWGQFLANAGYMVLQPQYRMSVGWGQELFDSAYGEHGGKMQDDKDDGALYLVKEGLVDPDRMAMFGWSYGGYAALVAASRDPQIYQCVIAGAAVADPEKVYLKRSNPYTPKAIDDWAKRRGMIGVNPINEVDKVNVPVFMVHGDVDARVLYFNFEDYKSEFEKAGMLNPRVLVENSDGTVDAPDDAAVGSTNGVTGAATATQKANFQPKHRFVTLEGADHFYVTLMYNHQEKLYTEMLDFLKNDCGPGGL